MQPIIDAMTQETPPRAWITYRRKDGSGEHSGTIATNPKYVAVHGEWLWQSIPIPASVGKIVKLQQRRKA